MINFKDYLDEEKRGLWANIHAKRERIKNGSGERMRKPGEKGAPTAADFKAANEEVEIDEGWKEKVAAVTLAGSVATGAGANTPKVPLDKAIHQATAVYNINKAVKKHKEKEAEKRKSDEKQVKEELTADEQFDIIEEMVTELAQLHNLDPELVWEKFEDIEDSQLFEYAIDKKGHKSSTGGLTQKGVDAYNRETGGHLQMAVTTPPSKLKKGSKAYNRRKSFCARMGGVKGPMKDEKGRPTRKALALKKWNC